MHKFEPTRVEKTKKKNFSRSDFFCFLCKWRELVKETFYVKKNRGHQAFKLANCKRSYRNGYSPYMCKCIKILTRFYSDGTIERLAGYHGMFTEKQGVGQSSFFTHFFFIFFLS